MGSLLAAGCFIAPMTTVFLNLTYFASYQCYFFSETLNRKLGISAFEDMDFMRVCQIHVIAASTLYGFKLLRRVKKLTKK